MPPPLRLLISTGFLTAEQFKSQDNHTKNKHKKTDPVYAVHITNPFIFWPVRIFFPEEKVFGYLSENAHTVKLIF